MGKRFIRFGSIDQFRTIVKNVKRDAQFVSYNEETKEVTIDEEAKMPSIEFSVSEKIHGCFEKNSLVLLANGEQIPISEVKKGTFVMSYNHKIKQSVPNKVLASFKQKLDKEWCKLVFDKTEIICTKDHKVWTENRGYVEAQNLTSNDVFKTA